MLFRSAIRLVFLEVAELCRCRKMFVVQSHELSPGSRRSSRSHRDVDGIVVQGASSRVKTLPKNLIARVPCRTFSEQRFRRPSLARAVRATLAMGTTESSSGRRERSPKKEYLNQVLKCVWMRGGRGGLYRRGGASGSDERQLLV